MRMLSTEGKRLSAAYAYRSLWNNSGPYCFFATIALSLMQTSLAFF
jgi:hypothetical protein